MIVTKLNTMQTTTISIFKNYDHFKLIGINYANPNPSLPSHIAKNNFSRSISLDLYSGRSS